MTGLRRDRLEVVLVYNKRTLLARTSPHEDAQGGDANAQDRFGPNAASGDASDKTRDEEEWLDAEWMKFPDGSRVIAWKNDDGSVRDIGFLPAGGKLVTLNVTPEGATTTAMNPEHLGEGAGLVHGAGPVSSPTTREVAWEWARTRPIYIRAIVCGETYHDDVDSLAALLDSQLEEKLAPLKARIRELEGRP